MPRSNTGTTSTGSKTLVKRWAKGEDFNPLSSHQVMAWCKSHGYKVPLNRKTRKPTTGKDALSKLIRLYPQDLLLPKVLEARHLSKAIGYLDDSRLGRDGKFHPTYTFAPDTGRLASINPNFQNQPKHGVEEALARAIRETIVPSEGFVLVELDWKAIEAVLTGWFAGDTAYQRLSVLDSHSYLAWHILFEKKTKGVYPPPPMDHPRLETLLKEFKSKYPAEREVAKKVNHATNYGMGPKHLGEDLKISIYDAARLLQIKAKSAPLVAEWQAKVRLQAHTEGFLENPFGYRRYFFEVFKKDRNGRWVNGDEANKALAFLPQSTAAAMCREAVLLIAEEVQHGWPPDTFHILVPIHDSFLIEVRERHVDAVVEQVKKVMERSWKELNGLSIAVDVKRSEKSWADMG